MSALIGIVVLALVGLGIWLMLRGQSGPSKVAASPEALPHVQRRAAQSEGQFHWPGTGDFEFEVVGESFYQKELARIAGAHGEESVEVQCTASLVPESDNEHDPKAVAVLVNSRKVAHLSREDARSFRRRLGQRQLTGQVTTCDAIVVGGGTRRNGEKLMYGIKLDIKPFEQ